MRNRIVLIGILIVGVLACASPALADSPNALSSVRSTTNITAHLGQPFVVSYHESPSTAYQGKVSYDGHMLKLIDKWQVLDIPIAPGSGYTTYLKFKPLRVGITKVLITYTRFPGDPIYRDMLIVKVKRLCLK